MGFLKQLKGDWETQLLGWGGVVGGREVFKLYQTIKLQHPHPPPSQWNWKRVKASERRRPSRAGVVGGGKGEGEAGSRKF